MFSDFSKCFIVSPFPPQGNPLLMNSATHPELTVERTYSSPMCFQDAMDKESSLFDPLADMKVKVQSSFMVSRGVTDCVEYHVKGYPDTFPRGLNTDYRMMESYNKTLVSPIRNTQLKITGVFGHLGGRLVVPNSGMLMYRHNNCTCQNAGCCVIQPVVYRYFCLDCSVNILIMTSSSTVSWHNWHCSPKAE